MKKATALGLSEKQAEREYFASLQKLGFNDLPMTSTDTADFKDELRQQGSPPPYYGNDQDYDAVNYNHHLISERDRLGAKNPDLQAVGGGLMGGGLGAALGAGAGHMTGNMYAGALDRRRFPNAMKHLPGKFRTGGMILGALAGGIPGAVNARHKVELAQRLQDPNNLNAMIRQMQMERHLANNQF